MNTRSFISLAVAACALAAPHAAAAADLHVTAGAGVTTCAEDDPCSLDQAITIADIVSNADTIHVNGPLDHSGAVDLSNSPIDLIGSGSGAGGTAIAPGSGALVVGDGSSASALSVRSTGNTNVAVHLESGGSVDHAEVVAEATGVRVEFTAGGELATLRDSHVVAKIGISATSPIYDADEFRLERSTVEATAYGVAFENGVATIANSVIRARRSGAHGIFILNNAEIAIDGSTVDGGGSGAFGVATGIASNPKFVLTGSIVRGFETDLFANNQNQPYGLSVSDSDFATRDGVSVRDLGGNLNADPHWLDAANGDYRLAAGSPLIDRGATHAAAPGETDRAANPRVVDGNDDGVAARDIGAYESPKATPPADPGPSDMQGGPAGPSGTQPAAPQTTPQPTGAPPLSALTVKVGKLVLNRRGKGRVAVTCSVAPCTVRLVLRTTAKRPRTLARATGSVGAVKFQLSRSARAYVKKHRIRKVAVTATAIDATGRRTQVRRIVRLP